MKRRNRSMLEGPLLPNIVLYAIPVILTSLLQLLFNAADLVVVGRFCGGISVASVGATNAITSLIVNLFIGFSVGAGVSVAHGLGAKEDAVVHRTVHTALPMALLSGAVLTVIGVTFADDFLMLMGTPENVLPLSTLYMRIYFGGITFNMVYNFCAAILRASGDTKNPLYFLTFAGIINVLLNVLFVTVFNMNVAGVALATTISQGISAVLVVIALIRRKDSCRLQLRKIRFYKPQLLKMIRIGLPAGIQSSLFAISNVIIQSSINSFGEIVMSGNAAAQNLDNFLSTISAGFHQTALNFVGQNVGARQFKRARSTLFACLGCALVFSFCAGNLLYHFGPQLLSIYITDSQEAISYGLMRMSVMCITYFIGSMMDTTTGALRGMGTSVVPMVLSILGVCGIRLGWIFTIFQLPQFHTPYWLYVSYPITWTFTLIAQFIAFILVYRKHIRTEQSTLSPKL